MITVSPWSLMFKYHGILQNRDRAVSQWSRDGMFYCRLAKRLFAPKMISALTCPIRKQAWVLDNECFDYRPCRTSGGLATRGGEWFSRCESSLFGELYLRCPQDAELPAIIHVDIRASWFPARCAVNWLDGGTTYQKLPHRAPEGEASIWETLRYDETVFTDQHRRDFPEAFVEYTAPPRPDTATSSVVTDPPKRETKSLRLVKLRRRKSYPSQKRWGKRKLLSRKKKWNLANQRMNGGHGAGMQMTGINPATGPNPHATVDSRALSLRHRLKTRTQWPSL